MKRLAGIPIWYYVILSVVTPIGICSMPAVRNQPIKTGQHHRSPPVTDTSEPRTVALRIADDMGLLAGPKSKHFNAKVSPKLFEAAAKRLGTTSPAAVITAALAALATEDELGPWLAANWGTLADTSTELLEQIDL